MREMETTEKTRLVDRYKLSILIPVWNQEELVVKALDHLPRRDDTEVVVYDDGSTDRTFEVVTRYAAEHPDLKMKVITNPENHGLAYAKNRLLENSTGEYFHFHDSDDWVDTKLYNRIVNILGEADVYGMDIVINSGYIWKLRDRTKQTFCGQPLRFIRRSFVEGMTFDESVKVAEDWAYAEELLSRNPKTIYTGMPVYHYNFPREGSLVDLRIKGILK